MLGVQWAYCSSLLVSSATSTPGTESANYECLTWTIIYKFLSFRTGVSTALGVTLVNSCVAMMALYISYIISFHATVSKGVCAAFSAIFHYTFLLSAFALVNMAIFRLRDPTTGMFMSVAFKTVFFLNWGKKLIKHNPSASALTIFSSIAAAPLAIVATSIAPEYTNYINDEL